MKIKYPYKEIKEGFLKNTENHSMQVKLDNGVYRHLVFSNNGSSVFKYSLVTWPGYLTICGDMGTWTFCRLEDMFEFFRNEKGELAINCGYWGQKIDSNCEWKEYDQDRLKEIALDYLERHIEEEGDDDELNMEVSDLIDSLCGDFVRDYDLLDDFIWNGKKFFVDLWDHDFESPKYHYLWCCFAIVKGIMEYDKFKEEKGE